MNPEVGRWQEVVSVKFNFLANPLTENQKLGLVWKLTVWLPIHHRLQFLPISFIFFVWKIKGREPYCLDDPRNYNANSKIKWTIFFIYKMLKCFHATPRKLWRNSAQGQSWTSAILSELFTRKLRNFAICGINEGFLHDESFQKMWYILGSCQMNLELSSRKAKKNTPFFTPRLILYFDEEMLWRSSLSIASLAFYRLHGVIFAREVWELKRAKVGQIGHFKLRARRWPARPGLRCCRVSSVPLKKWCFCVIQH